MSYRSTPVLQVIKKNRNDRGIFIGLYRWLFGRTRWRLHVDYEIPLPQAHVVIPSGFIFDGASIPPKGFAVMLSVAAFASQSIFPALTFLWVILLFASVMLTLLRPSGLLIEGALLHDFGYRHRYLPTKDGGRYLDAGTRAEFDRVFVTVSVLTNNVFLVDYLVYLAVRMWGWRAWARHRKSDYSVTIL